MRYGFTLIEVLIATAIASMLTVTLFFSFNQISNSVRKAADTVDIFDAALLVDQLLLKDVSGAFIPVQAIPPKETKKKLTGDKKPGAKAASKDKNAPEAEAGEKNDEKEGDQKTKVPLLKDPFMSSNKTGNMHVLTFITANPMQVFWGEKTGDPKPSCVRIVYTLEEKKDRKKQSVRYELYRQEDIKLDLAPYTKKETAIERYLIADNIVSCKLTFIVADEKQEEEQEETGDANKQPIPASKKKEEKKPEIEIKEFTEWATDKGKKDARTRLMLPNTVIMILTLSNSAETRESVFTFRIPVAATLQEVPVQEPPRVAPGQQKPEGKEKDADKDSTEKAKQDKNHKVAFVEGANRIVQSLRTKFGQV